MVVFGAGASYDSTSSFPLTKLPNHPHRPPLTDQLFEERPEFVRARALFPRCLPIIPYFQNLAGSNVEQVMEKLQDESEADPERMRQLVAIRYYLHYMLTRCVQLWIDSKAGVTNYKTLLDQIRHLKTSGEPVCLVTFNYDTLLEEVLPSVGVKLPRLSSYVEGEYKVIKIHGSVNWAREVQARISKVEERAPLDIANELIDRCEELQFSPTYEISNDLPIAKSGNRTMFPALTIPVVTKSGFECPAEHVDALTEFLPKVTRLLIIGWRATDERFVNLLAKGLAHETRAMVVSSSGETAVDIANRLRGAGVDARFEIPANHGFTNFVSKREVDGFLKA